MRITPLASIEMTAINFCNQSASHGSGEVVTAPQPVWSEPERFVGSPGVGGLRGSLSPGAPAKSRWRGGEEAVTSLVKETRNSSGRYTTEGEGGVGRSEPDRRLRSERSRRDGDEPSERRATNREPFCTDGVLLCGICDHGSVRYRRVPCKRRDCDICGPLGRYRIAERIALGVERYWPCAWLVLTYPTSVAENPSWKKEAVKQLYNRMIKPLRKRLGKQLQYVATYELTKRGRLHINLIIGPWSFVPHSELKKLWGARISVALVKNSQLIGKETAKAYSPRSLAAYLSKLEQAVPLGWGRRVSFSKSWPKLLKGGLPRVGSVKWWLVRGEDRIEFFVAEYDKRLIEVDRGEYAYVGETCFCFARDGPHSSRRATVH